jgi:protease-4
MTRTPGKLATILAAAVCFALLAPQSAHAAKKVIRLKFDGPISETPVPEFGLEFMFGGHKPRSLRDWVKQLDKAARDSTIAGAVMLIEDPSLNLAQLEELNRALTGFKAGGKKIYCYLDAGSNLTYALASVADHIALAENSTLDIYGLRAELMFFKGLLDKIGVEADMMHCGAYKSALEPFTRTEPSEEAAENVNWLLDGIYESWIGLIAAGRKLSPEQVKAAVDAAPLDSKKALELKLVDSVVPLGAFKQMIEKEYGKDVEIVKKYGEKEHLELDFENPFMIFTQLQELFSEATEKAAATKPGLGLIYIDGAIMMGRSEPDAFGGSSSAGCVTIRAAFEKAREDDNVKAVVVRVDSPGGSATASDIIWEAATRCAREKPVVVSMGGVAGSGGYYVSIPGDTIFAEATTITGSIGVVGGKLVWRELMNEKLGLTFTEFTRGKNAGLFSLNHLWTDEERKFVMDWLVSIYDQFKGRVKQSRGDRIKGDLESLAGGRVYTGKQALSHGLVDQIGGLKDAITFASNKAGLKDPEIYLFPKQKDFFDILKELFGEESDEDAIFTARFPYGGDPLIGAAQPLLKSLPDTPLARALSPAQLELIAQGLRNALIVSREHAGCFMPFSLRVR